MFGHGHAPGTDITGNVDFALGHGIGGPVAGIAMNDNPSAGIEPADIIGGRSQNFNLGVGKSHRTNALPGLTGYFYVHLFLAGLPKPAADSVLTVGIDLQAAVPLGYRCLQARVSSLVVEMEEDSLELAELIAETADNGNAVSVEKDEGGAGAGSAAPSTPKRKEDKDDGDEGDKGDKE